jgi:hypothetical protein
MKSYRILVHDRREAAPIELAAVMAHDARVQEFARGRLDADPNISGMEIWFETRKLCDLTRESRKAA